MQEWITPFSDWFSPDRLVSFARALVLIGVGLVLSRVAAAVTTKIFGPHLDAHVGMLIRRVIYYLVLILFLVSALRELGFNLGVLLGAAGILSVAVGFASQTSASNLISGLFLLSERPFAVGDPAITFQNPASFSPCAQRRISDARSSIRADKSSVIKANRALRWGST